MEKVSEGRVRVPKFQRDFRWTQVDVSRLFDSIYQGYPIGSLLLWMKPAPAELVTLGPLEIDAEPTSEALWVVDGQQRITSLAAVLLTLGDVADNRYTLYFDLQNRRFMPARTPVPAHWLPLNRINDTKALLRWLSDLQRSGATDELVSTAEELSARIREYKVPAYLVETDDIETLRTIFDRLNNFGKSLSVNEVFHALHGGRTSSQPEDLKSLGDHVKGLGFGQVPGNTLVRSVLALRAPDVYRDFRNEFAQNEDPADTFRQAEEAIGQAIAFLKGHARIDHIRVLPYRYVIPVLTRFFSLHRDPSERSLTLLRRWIWRDALRSGAKSNSVSTLRDSVRSVDENEDQSVQRLLKLVRGTPGHIDSTMSARLNEARTRANVALMATWGPRSLVDGSSLNVAKHFEDHANPIPSILKDAGLRGSLGSRIIQGPTTSSPGDLLLDSPLRRSDPLTFEETLESHQISMDSLAAFESGDHETFFLTRLSDLDARLEESGSRMAEWTASDRPPIGALVVLDGDSDD